MLQVVERLNNSPHLEKIHYFMSKADVVEKEHDRQRVLIQITQNLATRIRNSHAFNLPTVRTFQWLFFPAHYLSLALAPRPYNGCFFFALSLSQPCPLASLCIVLPTTRGRHRSRHPQCH